MTQPPPPTGQPGYPNPPSWPAPDWPTPEPPPGGAPPSAGPGRGWYGLALGLVVVAVLVCCGGGLLGTRVVPDPLATAPIGEALTVTMGGEEEFAVVVKLDATMPADTGSEMVTCDVSGAGSTRTSWSQWEWLLTTSDGQWRLDHHITVPGPQTGSYQVTCKSTDSKVTEFGIARAPASGQSAFGLGAMICCPFLLLIVAAILTIVIRTKRSRARKAATEPGPPGPPHHLGGPPPAPHP